VGPPALTSRDLSPNGSTDMYMKSFASSSHADGDLNTYPGKIRSGLVIWEGSRLQLRIWTGCGGRPGAPKSGDPGAPALSHNAG